MYFEVWWKFFLNVSILVAITVLAVFIGIFMRNKELIEQEIEARARSYYDTIVLVRYWSAQYRGLFVEKTDGVESNPHLENPDITDISGKVYTKKNPAIMTREVSDLAAREGKFAFRITSLNPLNPNNAPDGFEIDALHRFENGEPDARTRETVDGKVLFRYMGPLYVEQGCLACHAKQGYVEGQLRGGISVSFDITKIADSLTKANMIILGLAVFLATLLIGIIYFFILRLMQKLKKAMHCIEEMAVTDDLTGLHNRRHLFRRLSEEHLRAIRHGAPLACIMADIDFFKKINDKHGHQSGDAVLRDVAEILKAASRQSDVAGRYGGEEFLIVLPETTLEGAKAAAEKIRTQVEKHAFKSLDGQTIPVTLSLGCAALGTGAGDAPPSVEAFLSLADRNLYRAKSKGRNRVEAGTDEHGA